MSLSKIKIDIDANYPYTAPAPADKLPYDVRARPCLKFSFFFFFFFFVFWHCRLARCALRREWRAPQPQQLHWDTTHVDNSEQTHCYCARPRTASAAVLFCDACHCWFHADWCAASHASA